MNTPIFHHIDFDSNHFRPLIAVTVTSTVNTESRSYIAWIDSGATNTVFSKKIMDDLSFVKISDNELENEISGNTPNGSTQFLKRRIKIKIQGTDNSIFEDGIDTCISKNYFDGENHQILIGLDILSRAKFIYNGKNKTFELSFTI